MKYLALTFAALASVSTLAACGSVTDGKGNSPTIATITPTHGPRGGGVTVTIIGTNFQAEQGAPLVLVNGRLADAATATSSTELTFTLPASTTDGDVDVSVATQSGFSSLPKGFRYNAIPTVASISPPFGRSVGGTPITIKGTGFTKDEAGLPTISLGGVAAANIQVVDDSTLMAVTSPVPANTAAFVPIAVAVTNANGVGERSDSFRISKPGLIAVERSNNDPSRIFHIDIETKATIEIGVAERRLIGCATAPNGTIFSVVGRNQSTQQLVTINPFSGVITTLGPLRTSDSVDRRIGALTFSGNNLIGSSGSSQGGLQRLVNINQVNGQVTPIGTTPSISRCNAIAPKDGVSVFQASTTNGPLTFASLATSVLTPTATLTGSSNTGNQVCGMAAIGSTLFIAEKPSGDSSNVYTANTTTGALTFFASVPGAISGLCTTPASF
jgi:hypothetical protein